MGTISISQLFVVCLLLLLMFGDISKFSKKIKKNFKSNKNRKKGT